jgi:radical SAM superfamily enzyme YgiQ (UPF0313 family)
MADVIIWTSVSEHPGVIRSAGAYSLKSWLTQNGYTVKVIDFCSKLTIEDIYNITSRFLSNETIAIGISTTFFDLTTLDKLVAVRKLIEESNNRVQWIAGGYFAGTNRVKELERWIQFSGIGEDNLLRWLDTQSGNTVERKPFDITCANQMWDDSDIIFSNEALPIELGRGCKFKCKFCQYPLIGKTPGTYIRNLNHVRNEMISNYERWGVTNYYFIDDTVNEDDGKMQQLVDISQSLPFKLQWVGYQRADLIYSHPHQAQWIKDSGCIGTFFGIESLNPEAAKTVGKGWNGIHARDYVPNLINNIWNREIGLQVGLIIGLPGDTEKDAVTAQQWCIDSNIHEWGFKALFIARENSVWQSEFDRNHGLYGYKFNDPKSSINWSNKHWSFLDAIELEKQLWNQSTLYKKPGCWTRNSLYTSVGRLFKEELYNSIDKTDIEFRVDARIKEYVVRSLEYPQY